ncbi:MAG: hypothetical protein IKM97_01095, partial [Clostridia bacterium]|nr:hypothetical protein [Clostridia bacterium]
YKKNKNINYFNNKFIIQNQDTQEYKSLHTQMNYIEEFNLINDKYDCKRAGMFAKSIAVNLKKGLYKIFIEYKNDGENILVDTGIFFNN